MSVAKIALVTGAGGGIGSEIAKTLANDGFQILCIDKDIDKAEKLASALPAARAFRVDLTSKSEIEKLRSILEVKNLMPSHIVNVAGVFFTHDLIDLKEEDYELIMDINVKGIYLLCQTFLPHLIENKFGNIINIASTAGLRGGRKRAIYSASKAAVISLTRSMTLDYGHLGIRTNVICPGLIDTPMADWITQDQPRFREWEQSLPARRIGTPRDIARVVRFLASEDSSYLYGSTIVVDGGGSA